MAQQDPLELAKLFVKTVVRMFYETEHFVVIDALAFHSALSVPDMTIVLDHGKNTKYTQKILGKLRESGLISVYVRQEVRDGAMKASNKEYYYIDYRRAIDATKYKLHKLDTTIKENAKPTSEKKELSCPQCKAQWTTMEVLDNSDPYYRRSGFLCKQCEHPLDMIDPEGEADQDGDDTQAKFNRFFKPLLDLMQKVDEVTIPAIEGHDALEGAVEIIRDKDINPSTKSSVVTNSTARPTTVKGVATAPEKIEVSIASGSEFNEAAQAAERERQAKIGDQNQLPVWHTKSTVIKETTSGEGGVKTEMNGTDTPTIKMEAIEEQTTQQSNLDEVYEKLREAQLAEQLKQEQEESDEEEDDDEFEDVPVTAPVVVPVPSEGPDAKRIKREPSPAAPSPANVATPAVSTGDGGEESEEDEFVDV